MSLKKTRSVNSFYCGKHSNYHYPPKSELVALFDVIQIFIKYIQIFIEMFLGKELLRLLFFKENIIFAIIILFL